MTFSPISFSVFLGSLESDLRIATCLFIRLFGLSYLKMIEPGEMNLGFIPKKQQSMCVCVCPQVGNCSLRSDKPKWIAPATVCT